MSKTKFNGFEKWFITTALQEAIKQAEQEVINMSNNGKTPIYAEGYFTMVGNELIDKVNSMTLKKDQ
jgi:hypothetical protein